MDSYFVYKNLENYLFQLKEEGIKSIILQLLISLEKDYYEGENLKFIIQDLKNITKNNQINVAIEGVVYTFKIEKIQLEIGDTLNRHMWYYRFCEKYMENNNITDEKDIPLEKIKEFEEKAFKAGKLQGEEWLIRNSNSINQLFSKDYNIMPNINLSQDITQLFEGNKEIPPIEFVSFNYWTAHKSYKKKEEALKKAYTLENNLLKRAIEHEASYFYEKKMKRENILFKDLFIKQSKKYLFDESIAINLKNYVSNNILEFYFGSKEGNYTQVIKGRKAKNSIELKPYIESSLSGIARRKMIYIMQRDNVLVRQLS